MCPLSIRQFGLCPLSSQQFQRISHQRSVLVCHTFYWWRYSSTWYFYSVVLHTQGRREKGNLLFHVCSSTPVHTPSIPYMRHMLILPPNSSTRLTRTTMGCMCVCYICICHMVCTQYDTCALYAVQYSKPGIGEVIFIPYCSFGHVAVWGLILRPICS